MMLILKYLMLSAVSLGEPMKTQQVHPLKIGLYTMQGRLLRWRLQEMIDGNINENAKA